MLLIGRQAVVGSVQCSVWRAHVVGGRYLPPATSHLFSLFVLRYALFVSRPTLGEALMFVMRQTFRQAQGRLSNVTI